MKRSSFFKSLAALVFAPKLIGEINWGNECLFSKDRLNERLSEQQMAEMKLSDIVNRKPPSGYAVRIDRYRKNREYAMGKIDIGKFREYLKFFHNRPYIELYKNKQQWEQ